MNNTKKVLCNIITAKKDERKFTFKSLQSYLSASGCKVSNKQINQIVNHDGNEVSVTLLDEIIHSLGYSTEVMITPHYE